jgi:hypothetical protein
MALWTFSLVMNLVVLLLPTQGLFLVGCDRATPTEPKALAPTPGPCPVGYTLEPWVGCVPPCYYQPGGCVPTPTPKAFAGEEGKP